MDYRHYLEWTELSGIYVRQESHNDRYRTFKEQISPEGLNTLIVGEFLNDNPDETLNVPNWRTYSVYELAGDKYERLERTAAALEAIGAPRAAEAVRTSVSPFDALMDADEDDPDALLDAIDNIDPLEMLGHIRESAARLTPDLADEIGSLPGAEPTATSDDTESWQEIEQLLESYVERYQEPLQADLATHGDPRILPGFTREGRLKELEQQQNTLFQRETQLEEIPKIRKLMKELQGRIGRNQQVTKQRRRKLKAPRQTFLDQLQQARELSAETPVPEMLALLDEAEQFMRANPAFFEEQPLGDTQLERRLDALGAYKRREDSGEINLFWEKPLGFEVDWIHFALSLTFPEGAGDRVIEGLVAMAERVRKRIRTLSEQWKTQLIEQFREQEGFLSDWQIEDAEIELDDAGRVTDASILKMAGEGQIHLLAYDKEAEEIACRVAFSAEDWDPEHGVELEWDEDSEDTATETAPTDEPISLADITLLEAGPVVRDKHLDQLEQALEITLPTVYRSFLLQSNGGIPQPNHLALRSQGELFAYDLAHFFSLADTNHKGAVPAERSLEAVLRLQPPSLLTILLPIGRLKPYVFSPLPDGDYLFLVRRFRISGW